MRYKRKMFRDSPEKLRKEEEETILLVPVNPLVLIGYKQTMHHRIVLTRLATKGMIKKKHIHYGRSIRVVYFREREL